MMQAVGAGNLLPFAPQRGQARECALRAGIKDIGDDAALAKTGWQNQ